MSKTETQKGFAIWMIITVGNWLNRKSVMRSLEGNGIGGLWSISWILRKVKLVKKEVVVALARISVPRVQA